MAQRAGREVLAKEVSLEDVEEASEHSEFSSIAVFREDPWPKPKCWCLLLYCVSGSQKSNAQGRTPLQKKW